MILGIIPARYASTRFPGKPLIDIQGKSMIQRVYEAAKASALLSDVVVATDDIRIREHVEAFGGKAVMTREDHPSGTDRCQEALLRWQEAHPGETAQYVVNIQGDEPFLDPAQIDELAAALDGTVELATQMIQVHTAEALHDPGEAKIVLNAAREVLLFSRQAIPYLRNVAPEEWHLHHVYYRHVGMYAYRTDILEAITRLAPSSLEKAESLEQLRWLEAGYSIKVVETQYDSHCIDTEEDVEKVLKLLQK
ncbi:3-deoxy-manno-octulosonate cytidylyltransferase [Siphonobacter aquaeclarae]|uniref:3-deoxy-manno-octulosonate cytidylyltransferase n=1 Tax=Siphonobacter aquaeclarae TaxID=563176 RepID=A0A1G9Q8Q7_9BACT|nr:3-deoxy-manno-octulosonate cytidylyltransferase [Siphonobacter aquaeclarae]SDM07406.1 3-deoxy-manno-octulosonate cytidylyltransferase (CMP-KDO synthetase) [Siphonobacter aquaeclarae]